MKFISVGIKTIAGILAAIWAALTPLTQVLIVFMALDIATGVLAAFINKELSSDVSFKGVAKKAIILLIVAAGFWLERCMTVHIPVAEVVAGFYIMHEGLSILENAARADLPVPQVLKDALSKMNGKEESK